MPAWIAEMAALRGRGLEPIPQRKFFFQLAGLMNYICDLITVDPKANNSATCKANLPNTAIAPVGALAPAGSLRIGDVIRVSTFVRSADATTGGRKSSAGVPQGKDETAKPVIVPPNPSVLNNFELSLTANDIRAFQTAACMTPTGATDLGPRDSPTRIAIQNALGDKVQELTDRRATLLRKRLKRGQLREGVCPTPPAPTTSPAPTASPAPAASPAPR